MKKVVIVISIVIIALGIGAYFILNSNSKESIDNTNETGLSLNDESNTENENTVLATNINNVGNTTEMDEDENTENSSNTSKTLVVYYSAQNHTKAVAEKIAENLNADIFEIIPEEIYTDEDLNWTSDSRVSREHDDESLRNIKLENTNVDNWDNYDTVYIGYPIWWGIAAWPVDTFVKENDFNGKTVIPFCTSASSGLGQSGKLLEKEANGGDWQDGHRFNERPTDADIEKWLDSVK